MTYGYIKQLLPHKFMEGLYKLTELNRRNTNYRQADCRTPVGILVQRKYCQQIQQCSLYKYQGQSKPICIIMTINNDTNCAYIIANYMSIFL